MAWLMASGRALDVALLVVDLLELETTAAAAAHVNPIMPATSLKRSSNALAGWRKCKPSRSRMRLPDELVSELVAVQMARGMKELALMTWLGKEAYLRPCELRTLRHEELCKPAGGPQQGL